MSTVVALAFLLIHLCIRQDDEVVRRLGSILVGRKSHGDLNACIAEDGSEAFSENGSGLWSCLWSHEGELVSAEPGGDIDRSAGLVEDLSKSLDQSVSRRVAVAIVDGLEPIEIEDSNGDRT
jgi:hypothetical protein